MGKGKGHVCDHYTDEEVVFLLSGLRTDLTMRLLVGADNTVKFLQLN